MAKTKTSRIDVIEDFKKIESLLAQEGRELLSDDRHVVAILTLAAQVRRLVEEEDD